MWWGKTCEENVPLYTTATWKFRGHGMLGFTFPPEVVSECDALLSCTCHSLVSIQEQNKCL
jgi:hypothetical protein